VQEEERRRCLAVVSSVIDEDTCTDMVRQGAKDFSTHFQKTNVKYSRFPFYIPFRLAYTGQLFLLHILSRIILRQCLKHRYAFFSRIVSKSFGTLL
jgi:hypothetical protein